MHVCGVRWSNYRSQQVTGCNMGHYDRLAQLDHKQIFALEAAMDGGPPLIAEFDLLNVPAFCLDEKAAITWLNSAATALLARSDGLCQFGAGLTAVSDNYALQQLIRRGAAGENGALRLERPSGAAALAAIAVPCRRQPGRIWLFVLDPLAAPPAEASHIARLTALYRLTAAEATIALQIASGSGLPAIAVALELSPLTVRTHTKHIFSKMRVHNQVQLARLVLHITMFDA